MQHTHRFGSSISGVHPDGPTLEHLEERTLLSADWAFMQMVTNGSDGFTGMKGAIAVAASPDGKSLYAVGEGTFGLDGTNSGGGLTVMARNPANGTLSFVQSFPVGGKKQPVLRDTLAVAVSPDGANVYVVNCVDSPDAGLIVFSRNAATGKLTLADNGIIDGLQSADGITVSPDGKSVYVTVSGDTGVAVFSRAADGQLSFQQIIKNGDAGIDFLYGAWGVTVSPDNKNVYVTGCYSGSLAVFTRNTTTGALTFQQVLKDGVGGVDGLSYDRDVIISPDGKNVYVTGGNDSALSMFSRSAVDGSLTYLGMVKSGVNGVTGLNSVFWAAVSPDGSQVVASGLGTNSLVGFDRNPVTGLLTQTFDMHDGVSAPIGLCYSPDGANLYAAMSEGACVSAYDLANSHALQQISNGQKLTYTDPDGSKVTLRVTNGTAEISLLGYNVDTLSAPSAKTIAMTGSGIRATGIILTSASAQTKMTITVSGGKTRGATLGQVQSNQIVGSFSAPNVDLVGDGVNMTGAAYIGSTSLRDFAGSAAIIMAGNGSPVTLSLRQVMGNAIDGEGPQFSFAGAIKSLTAADWGYRDLTAPWVGSIKTTGKGLLDGNWGGTIRLTGANAVDGNSLASIKVAGSLAGTMSISGAVGSITAGTIDHYSRGGQISALRIGSIKVAGDALNFRLVLNADYDPIVPSLGSLTVGGWMNGLNGRAFIKAVGSLGKLSFGGIEQAEIFAGVNNVTALPVPANDFINNTSKITSLTVKGKVKDGGFATRNLWLAAPEIGTVALSLPQFDNGGMDWGIASNHWVKVSYKDAHGNHLWVTGQVNQVDFWVIP